MLLEDKSKQRLNTVYDTAFSVCINPYLIPKIDFQALQGVTGLTSPRSTTSVTISQMKIMFPSQTLRISLTSGWDACLIRSAIAVCLDTRSTLASVRRAQGLLKIGQNPSVCHFAFAKILADNKCVMSEKACFTSVFALRLLHGEAARQRKVLSRLTFEETCKRTAN